jgi:transposase
LTDTFEWGHDPRRRCSMGSRKQFTPEFKREAVQLLESGSRSGSELARELGIKRNQLYKWQTELRARGGAAFPGSGARKERTTEIARLKRELARVTEERDILKKAAAFFARESP